MPRPRNHDAHIARLVRQLKDAVFARERSRIEDRIDAQVAALMGEARPVQNAGTAETPTVARRPAAKGRGNRTPRSAASRRKQAEKMKAYWAAKRKAGTAKRGARAKATAGFDVGGSKTKPTT
jgi:hypothetical protein